MPHRDLWMTPLRHVRPASHYCSGPRSRRRNGLADRLLRVVDQNHRCAMDSGTVIRSVFYGGRDVRPRRLRHPPERARRRYSSDRPHHRAGHRKHGAVRHEGACLRGTCTAWHQAGAPHDRRLVHDGLGRLLRARDPSRASSPPAGHRALIAGLAPAIRELAGLSMADRTTAHRLRGSKDIGHVSKPDGGRSGRWDQSSRGVPTCSMSTLSSRQRSKICLVLRRSRIESRWRAASRRYSWWSNVATLAPSERLVMIT